MDESAQLAAMETATDLRTAGQLRVDLFPEVTRKMDKIFKHVDQRKAKFIAILGTDEVDAGTVTLRTVATKTRDTMPRAEAASFIERALRDEPKPSA
jgi:histidyl-tRNA synthetase